MGFKAPGIDADGDVIGKRIIAGEIEIDQTGKPVAEKKTLSGKRSA